MEWLEKYGADAARYWSASGRPGTDTTFDENQLKVGRKLATKILNVAKFVLTTCGAAAESDDGLDDRAHVREPLDRSMLASLDDLVIEATESFEEYDYARALERVERFFWVFCDDYVELVKGRAYGSAGEAGGRSAAYALRHALSTLLRLLAPFMPYVTEEAWSWWHDGSIHVAAWPRRDESVRDEVVRDEVVRAASSSEGLVYEVAATVLSEVRKVKSTQKRSLATPVVRAVVSDTPERLAALDAAQADVCDAGKIRELDVVPVTDGSAGVEVELAEPDAPAA
jgi:valyl-tRNA synthetase